MVERITSSLAREAILAAIKDQTDAARNIRGDASQLFDAALNSTSAGSQQGAARGVSSTDQSKTPIDSVRELDSVVRSAEPDRMAEDLLSGDIKGFHDVAARINRARISFDFAMEVRNKLIDAYRETMRMTV